MERKRGTTIAVVAALIIAIVSLGVAFAAFSTTLNINGTATVQTSKWEIYFAGTATGSKPSSAGALPSGNISKSGTANSTSTSLSADTFSFVATLKTPGDYVLYKIYVRNTGNYRAKVGNVITPAITCTYADDSSAQTFCNSHVTYKIYTNSNLTTELAQNHAIAAGNNGEYYVKIMLNDNFATNGSDLPTQAVTVTATPLQINYVQY